MTAGQDKRIRGALLELVDERGYDDVAVSDVIGRAGVEQADFDRLFDGKEELCFAVFEDIAAAAESDVLAAFEAEGLWRDGLRASAYTIVRFMRDNPREVGFGAVHILAAGDLVQAYRERQLQCWVDLIDLGRQELDDPDSMGRGVAEGVLGSIHARLLKELGSGSGTDSLEQFVPELMYIAVRPYLGHEVAREELELPAPPERREPARPEPGSSEGDREGVKPVPQLARLPRGRHGLPREFVTKNQRDRLTAGTIAVVAENGLNETTIAQICAAAGVSRRTFYAYFPSKEECFFAAYDTIVKYARIDAEVAATDQVEWPAKVAAKLQAGLEFAAANPDLARFCIAVPQQAGEQVAARYREVVGRVIAYLCEGMPPPPATKTPPEAVAASLTGGMSALVMRKVNAGEGEGLSDLLPDLIELFLAPFLGRPEAMQVAQVASG
jgi:AcrR family transcriptional regulator